MKIEVDMYEKIRYLYTQEKKSQRQNARRVYTRLVEELGFTGGESTVRRIVAEMKNKPSKAFVPLSYDPAEAAQIDWGEALFT